MKSKIIVNEIPKLNKFLADFIKIGEYAVDVGIMGDKNKRPTEKGKEAGLTNADIGAIHEFGSRSRGIRMRSFLIMPLFVKADRIIKETVMDNVAAKVEVNNPMAYLRTFGHACERAIYDAFDSRGFGTWAPNAPSTIARKKSSMPLIDLGFLRKSITSAVVKL